MTDWNKLRREFNGDWGAYLAHYREVEQRLKHGAIQEIAIEDVEEPGALADVRIDPVFRQLECWLAYAHVDLLGQGHVDISASNVVWLQYVEQLDAFVNQETTAITSRK